jgi:hypothetical protein
MTTRKILLLWLLIASSACYAKDEKSQFWQTDDYAVFNVETGGWVVVARGEFDDRILAYSGCGKLNRESLSESVLAWLDHYSCQVSMAGSRSVVAHRQPVATLIIRNAGIIYL